MFETHEGLLANHFHRDTGELTLSALAGESWLVRAMQYVKGLHQSASGYDDHLSPNWLWEGYSYHN